MQKDPTKLKIEGLEKRVAPVLMNVSDGTSGDDAGMTVKKSDGPRPASEPGETPPGGPMDVEQQ